MPRSTITKVTMTRCRCQSRINSLKYFRLAAINIIYVFFPFTIFAWMYDFSGAAQFSGTGIFEVSVSAASEAVSYETIRKGQISGIHEATQIVIRSAAAWQDLWRKHTAFQAEQRPSPAVDFGRDIVIGVFLGSRPTGGYAAEIVNIEKDNGMTTVNFKETTPPRGSMVTQSLTQPFHLVRVSADTIQAVRFRRLP